MSLVVVCGSFECSELSSRIAVDFGACDQV